MAKTIDYAERRGRKVDFADGLYLAAAGMRKVRDIQKNLVTASLVVFNIKFMEVKATDKKLVFS